MVSPTSVPEITAVNKLSIYLYDIVYRTGKANNPRTDKRDVINTAKNHNCNLKYRYCWK
jgi:hypothetical protein